MKHENILLKSALVLAIVDLVLIVAILLQVSGLVKDVLEVQNRQLEILVANWKLKEGGVSKKQETEKAVETMQKVSKTNLEISGWREHVGSFFNGKIQYSLAEALYLIEKGTPSFTGLVFYSKDVAFGGGTSGWAISMDIYEKSILAPGNLEDVIRNYPLQDKQEKIMSFNNATVFKLFGKDERNKKRAFAVWRENVRGNDFVIEFMTSGSSDYADTDEIAILEKIISTFKLIK